MQQRNGTITTYTLHPAIWNIMDVNTMEDCTGGIIM